MKSNRNVYIIYFVLSGLLGVFLLLSGGTRSSDDLSAALPPPGPGGQAGDMEGLPFPLPGMGGAGQEGDSIFDSQFFKQHRPENEEKLEKVTDDGSPEILEPAHPHNPVNPQTGLPYPDKLMERFEELRKRFPGNDVIPHRESPEEKQKRLEDNQGEFQLRMKVQEGRANQEEINQHYDLETKGVKDRLEILDYILEKQNKFMSPEVKKQYDSILAKNKEQMEQIEKDRQNALNKLLQ